jgi:phosphatidylglycerophosphatase A
MTPPNPFSFHNLIASGFGSGYSKKAPGTFGSIAALCFWWLTQQWHQGFITTVLLAACASSLGWWSTQHVLAKDYSSTHSAENKIDPSWIVIDEWAGMFLALLPCSVTTITLPILAFILFRFFDISKFSLVGRAESLPGSFGIMADDVVAGLFSAAIIFGFTLL